MSGFEIFAWLGVAISAVNGVADYKSSEAKKVIEPVAVTASAPAAIIAPSQPNKEKEKD